MCRLIPSNDGRLALARELGATHTLHARNEDAIARVAEICPSGVRFALDSHELTTPEPILRSV
jgi:aryl-alcohol dehydrogenase